MIEVRPNNPALPEVVPARMVNEFVYCPRLFYLEWVQSLFASNSDVVQGLYVHRVVDGPGGALPDKGEAWQGRRATSVWLTSQRLGFTAKLDVIEAGEDDAVIPVDYKKGSPDKAGEAWPSDRIQSLLQVMLLQEAGYQVTHAEIWYDEVRRRVVIPVDDSAIAEVTDILRRLWQVAALPEAPEPLVNSPKCPRCSLVGICLPDETRALRERSSGRRERLKRVMAPDNPARPLYVTTQGALVGVRGGRLEVAVEGQPTTSFRLLDVSQLAVFGNITISSQCVRELMSREIPVLWFSYGGWFSGLAEGLPGKNIDLRIAQYRTSPEEALVIARQMIAGKIHNSRTLLRRNSRENDEKVIAQLRDLVQAAREADSSGQLLGLEGTAARLYFSRFTKMLSEQSAEETRKFDENGRSRRPPPDPINALLSFCYSMLIKDITVASYAVGFDPYLGFLHQPKYGRPALALDLAEEFRPLIAESVVLQVLNNKEVKSSDFLISAGGCQLMKEGRQAVLRAYERRMDQEIVHPHFGYRVSYRRALDVQARMLAAYLLGEIPKYSPFVTR